MSGTKICTQTNVATVDNTAAPCDNDFMSTDCIIYSDAIAYLGLPVDSSMTDVVNALLLSLIDARNRIEILETP